MRRLFSAAVVLAISGCGMIGEPSRPDLFFSYAPVAEGGHPNAQRQVGGIDITGTIRTPCTPYCARGTMTVSGGVVELRVAARPEGACAGDGIGHLEYYAAVSLRPGTYRVRIIHEWPNTDWAPELALEREIAVGPVS